MAMDGDAIHTQSKERDNQREREEEVEKEKMRKSCEVDAKRRERSDRLIASLITWMLIVD
jgi:hypothetical protein